MKALIAILVLIAALYAANQLVSIYERTQKTSSAGPPEAGSAPAPVSPDTLDGLPSFLDTSLKQAQRDGAESLKLWLKNWRTYVRDPRLAAIELDYVVMASHTNPKDARLVFQSVKTRTRPDSLIYPRIKKLEKTYQ